MAHDLDCETPRRLVQIHCEAAGIDPSRLGSGIHSQHTEINDALPNAATMRQCGSSPATPTSAQPSSTSSARKKTPRWRCAVSRSAAADHPSIINLLFTLLYPGEAKAQTSWRREQAPGSAQRNSATAIDAPGPAPSQRSFRILISSWLFWSSGPNTDGVPDVTPPVENQSVAPLLRG